MEVIDKSYLEKLPHKMQVVFALFCAKQVEHLVSEQDKEAFDRCIDVVERWLEGRASKKECNAAYAAAKEQVIKKQWEYYDELLSFVDGRVDNLLLSAT